MEAASWVRKAKVLVTGAPWNCERYSLSRRAATCSKAGYKLGFSSGKRGCEARCTTQGQNKARRSCPGSDCSRKRVGTIRVRATHAREVPLISYHCRSQSSYRLPNKSPDKSPATWGHKTRLCLLSPVLRRPKLMRDKSMGCGPQSSQEPHLCRHMLAHKPWTAGVKARTRFVKFNWSALHTCHTRGLQWSECGPKAAGSWCLGCHKTSSKTPPRITQCVHTHSQPQSTLCVIRPVTDWSQSLGACHLGGQNPLHK